MSSRSWSADAWTSRACGRELLGLEEEVREHRDLRAQLVGRDRREDEVDRALRRSRSLSAISSLPYAVMKMIGVISDCCALADERGRLEAVHDRHADVEQDDREVLRHHAPQRASPESASTIAWPSGAQHRLQREPLRCVVVDDEDRDARDRRRSHRRRSAVPPASARASRARAAAVAAATARARRAARRCRPASGRSRWRRHRGSAGVRRPSTLPVTAMIGSVLNWSIAPDGAHGVVAVHDRHHDVHQDDVDVGRPLEDGERVGTALGDRRPRRCPVRAARSARTRSGSRRRRRGSAGR